ncbi:MAG: hypothetical protein AAGA58_19100 [Verrucomicrobiota bacterium]
MKYGEEAVYALLDLLNEAEISYMLVGSFSSNAYGEARATKDADFVVEISEEDRRGLLSKLPAEFEADPQASFETITGHTRQILRIPSIPFEIELFDLSNEEFDQERFSRRVKTSIGNRTLWLPTAEDVIIQKLRWTKLGKRDKDFLDVVGILKVRGHKLAWDYIEKWCGKLELMEVLQDAREEAGSGCGPG